MQVYVNKYGELVFITTTGYELRIDGIQEHHAVPEPFFFHTQTFNG